jgi:hypothetical protein
VGINAGLSRTYLPAFGGTPERADDGAKALRLGKPTALYRLVGVTMVVDVGYLVAPHMIALARRGQRHRAFFVDSVILVQVG